MVDGFLVVDHGFVDAVIGGGFGLGVVGHVGEHEVEEGEEQEGQIYIPEELKVGSGVLYSLYMLVTGILRERMEIIP